MQCWPAQAVVLRTYCVTVVGTDHQPNETEVVLTFDFDCRTMLRA